MNLFRKPKVLDNGRFFTECMARGKALHEIRDLLQPIDLEHLSAKDIKVLSCYIGATREWFESNMIYQ